MSFRIINVSFFVAIASTILPTLILFIFSFKIDQNKELFNYITKEGQHILKPRYGNLNFSYITPMPHSDYVNIKFKFNSCVTGMLYLQEYR